MDKPYYPHNSVSSVSVLSKTLNIPLETIKNLAKENQDNYIYFSKKLTKKDGTIKERKITEPKFTLKKTQKRIVSRILSHVEFPRYLYGGIKDKDNPRDYFTHAEAHVNANIVISLDIKDFYPSIGKDEVEKIFKYFFKFPPDVADVLVGLTTVNGSLPQGSPTSSYLANLIFYDKEYKVFSWLKQQNFTYTRLLDDIVISKRSKEEIVKIEKIIDKIIKDLLSPKKLKLNKNKVKIVTRKSNELMNVTGLWVNHSKPKLKKEEIKKIRAAVFQCEQESLISNKAEEYHTLWNKTSGRVAKLTRVGAPQAINLRKRMMKIMPVMSDEEIKKLIVQIDKLNYQNKSGRNRFGFLKRANDCRYRCSILSRSNKNQASNLLLKIKSIYPNITYKDFWEEN